MLKKARKVKVRALTPFSLGGGVDVAIGDEFELEAVQAKEKLARGWVEFADSRDDPDHEDEEDDEDRGRRPRGRSGQRHPHPEAGGESARNRDPDSKGAGQS